MTTRLINLKEVSHKTSVGKSWIYAEMREGRFPKPIKLAERCVRWLEREVDDWIDARSAERQATNPRPNRPI